MKKYIIFISIFAVLVTGSFIYFFFFRPVVSYDKDVFCTVDGPVSIKRDSAGIPSVTVSSLNDLYFTLGFIHAQDRYELIDYYRLIARAETGSRFGKNSTLINRLSNACGFYKQALKLENELDEKYKQFLQKYVNGINRAIEDGYVLSKYRWETADVLAVLLLKEWSNAFLNNRELVFPVNNEHRSYKLNDLFPRSLLYYYDEEESDGLTVLRTLKTVVEQYVGTFDRGNIYYLPAKNIRYNNNALAFSFEGTGTIYPGWYPAIINYKGKKYKTITHTGLPFIFSSSSDLYSFVGFNLDIDVQDFYFLEVRDNDDTLQYKTYRGWKELIQAPGTSSGSAVSGGQGDSGYMIKTDYGIGLNKIVNDDDLRDSIVTLHFDFPEHDYIISLFDIPFCRDLREARQKVRNVSAYPRVYFFTDGKQAYQGFAGKVPVRANRNSVFSQYYVRPWTGKRDLSFFSYPVVNSKVSGSSFFYYVPRVIAQFALNDEIRYRHIAGRVAGTKVFSEKSLRRFLLDTKSPVAEMFIPYFNLILKHNLLTSSNLTQIYFHNWDYTMGAKSVQASIFNTMLKQFVRETYSDDFPRDAGGIEENYYYLLPQFYALVQRNISPVFDDTATEEFENRDSVFDRAFIISMRRLNRKAGPVMDKWKWGKIYAGNYYIFSKNDTLLDDIFDTGLTEPFRGSADTIFKGPVCNNGAAGNVTALCGFYTQNRTNIFLNYAMSVSPVSEFNYARVKKIKFRRFEKIKGAYRMNLRPRPVATRQ